MLLKTSQQTSPTEYDVKSLLGTVFELIEVDPSQIPTLQSSRLQRTLDLERRERGMFRNGHPVHVVRCVAVFFRFCRLH